MTETSCLREFSIYTIRNVLGTAGLAGRKFEQEGKTFVYETGISGYRQQILWGTNSSRI